MPAKDLRLSPETVRARFDWALRQGQPRWFWPETNRQNWQAALIQIEHGVRHILAGNPGSVSIAGAPEDLGIAAFTSGTGPLLGHWAREGRIDSDPAVLTLIDTHLAHNLNRMKALQGYAIEVVDAMSNAGLNVTVLKGMHTAHTYFPVPGARPVADIDMLVDECEIEMANNTLRGLGYAPGIARLGEQPWRLAGAPIEQCSLSLVHRDSPWYIDLHTSLNRRYSPGAPMIHLDGAVSLIATRLRWAELTPTSASLRP